MKKLFILAAMLFALNCSAQVQRNGNTFSKGSSSRTYTKDTLVTQYSFSDRYGNVYPIIINKNTGSCYVWKTSKAGKKYKQYVGEEISREVCRELRIEYKPKKKN